MKSKILLILSVCLFAASADAYIAKTNSEIDTLIGTCPGTWSLTSQRCSDLGVTVKKSLPQNWNDLYAVFQSTGPTAERNYTATLFTAGEWNGQSNSTGLGFWDIVLTYAANSSPGSAYVIPVVDPATLVPYQVPWSALPGAGSGDVSGPASSVDNEIALFSGTTGKVIKRDTAAQTGTGGVVRTTAPTITDLTNSGAWFASGALTPTALTGDADNYNPTSLNTAMALRIDGGAADRNITGLASGSAGRVIQIVNIGATNNLILKNSSTNSTAANRFAIGFDLTLTPNQVTVIRYDTTSSRWRPFGYVGQVTVVDSEQTIANTNTAWASPNHVFRATAALTANRSNALPLAADYKKGERVLYIDKVTPTSSAFSRSFPASGSDTVNGSGSYTPFTGPGTMELETDGVSAWVSINDTATLVELRDPTSGFTVAFDLSALTANRLITLQDAAVTPAGLELSNVFTGVSQKMKHWKGTTGISVLVNDVNTTGAGVGATASLGTGSTDMNGTLTIVPAGTPGTSALYATFTFGAAFNNAPTGVVITGMNASAMNAQTTTKDILPTSITTTGFTITSGSAALVAGTTYIWTYQVLASGQ